MKHQNKERKDAMNVKKASMDKLKLEALES